LKPKLVVIGSSNRDLVVKTERIPAPGETVIGGAFVSAPGGKGGNQAVAASRLGAEVWFVGCVGNDALGSVLAEEMAEAGIHVDFLHFDPDAPTGVALIGVDARGQNAIIVAPGANHRVSRADVEAAREIIVEAYAVIVQLEIPMEAVEAAIDAASAAGTKVVLNPAPMRGDRALPDSLLRKVDILTPNEHEAAQILGHHSPEGLHWEEVAEQIRAKGVDTVVITLGDAGCLLADSTGSRRLPSMPVTAIDTTAAGDCFTGALAVGLAEGKSLDAAAIFATHAAGISVTRLGAEPSLPTRGELDELLPPA